MKWIFYMVVFAMFCVGCSQSELPFRNIQLNSALELAQQERKFVFIFFNQKGCGACDYMSNTIFRDSRVRGLLEEQFISIQREVPGSLNDSLAYLFRFIGFPAYVVLNPEGDVHRVSIGMKKTTEHFIDEFKGIERRKPSMHENYQRESKMKLPLDVISNTFKAYLLINKEGGDLDSVEDYLQSTIDKQAYFYNCYLMYSLLKNGKKRNQNDAKSYAMHALSFNSDVDQFLYADLKSQINENYRLNTDETGMIVDQFVIDLGTIKKGTGNTATFTVTNNCDEAIKVTGVRIPCGCILPMWDRCIIPTDRSDKVRLYFEPQKKGIFEEVIYIVSDASNSPVKVKVKAKVI